MKILFICTGNTCRSPMAAEIANIIADKNNLDHTFFSAGICADSGCSATIGAMDAVELLGGDLSNHSSTMVNEDMLNDADLILTMTQNHKNMLILKYGKYKDKIFTLKESAKQQGDIDDPFGQSTEIYSKTAKEIFDLLTIILLQNT